MKPAGHHRLSFAILIILGLIVSPAGFGEDRETVFVTSLQDSGEGTLREAVSQGNRVVKFQVGGEISLTKALEVSVEDLVIDGEGAPDPGITLTSEPFSLDGAKNVRIRHLRFRNSSDDNLRIIGACRDVIIENCTSTHGGDGAIDITIDYKTQERPEHITIRHCLLGATDKAMLVVSVNHLTLEGNLFTNNVQRNPQLHDATDFNLIGNVVRNYRSYAVRVRAGSRGNAVGNVIPLSPFRSKQPERTFLVDQTRGECEVYLSDNVGPEGFDFATLGTTSEPVGKLPAEWEDAATLEKMITDLVGARPLDEIDQALLNNDPSIPFRESNTKDP